MVATHTEKRSGAFCTSCASTSSGPGRFGATAKASTAVWGYWMSCCNSVQKGRHVRDNYKHVCMNLQTIVHTCACSQGASYVCAQLVPYSVPPAPNKLPIIQARWSWDILYTGVHMAHMICKQYHIWRDWGTPPHRHLYTPCVDTLSCCLFTLIKYFTFVHTYDC